MQVKIFHKMAHFVAVFILFGSIYAVKAQAAVGRWVAEPPMPESRTEVAVTALGSRIFVIGGFTETTVTARVMVYDTVSQKWGEAQALPRPVHHAAAVTIDGKIYVVGGFSSGIFWRATKWLFEYDPDLDQWNERRSMGTARGALAAVAYNGQLYAIGGLDGSKDTGAVERYDPDRDEWQRLQPLPTPRDHLGAAVIGDTIHVVGGRLKGSYANNLSVHEVYLIPENRWIKREPLAVARSGIAVVSYQRRLFVFGGETMKGTLDLNHVYDPKLNRWGELKPMPTPRHGLGAAVVDGAIYVLAGGTAPGGSYGNYNEAFYLP